MYFSHAPEVWQQFPQLVPGMLVVDGIHLQVDVEAQLDAWYQRARERLSQGPESQMPEISAWRQVYAQMGLKPTKYRSAAEALLRRFAQQQASTVEDIRKALSMGDAATAERAAHSLKGAAGTLGAGALSEAAAKAETAIKTGQGIDTALSSLSVDLASTVGAIRAALPDQAATNGGGLTRDPAAVVEPLKELKRLLESVKKKVDGTYHQAG